MHSEAGGGHAHVGCMIYLGDNWPDRYRGGVFMCNLHGNRINHDILERNGSSYVARHGKDFHARQRSVVPRHRHLNTAPTAASSSATGPTRANATTTRTSIAPIGRIFKITYGKPEARGRSTWRS